MNLLDIDLVDKPIDVDEFEYAQDQNYPICLLGFQIKNLYDQKRLTFNKNFKTKNIIHFVPNKSPTPKFFKGIQLPLLNEIKPFISFLNELGLREKEVSVDEYKSLLKRANLSCDNCYAYLCNGIYPVDSEHVHKIFNFNLQINEMYEKILNNKINGFQSFGYFVIYILSNKNYQKMTTKNFIYKAVKTYDNV